MNKPGFWTNQKPPPDPLAEELRRYDENVALEHTPEQYVAMLEAEIARRDSIEPIQSPETLMLLNNLLEAKQRMIL
jgi:hypothetical protein